MVEPAVIPLQNLGVVDIEGQDISSDEIMAHALSNMVQKEDRIMDDKFTICRGSAFVNEYPRLDPKTKQRND